MPRGRKLEPNISCCVVTTIQERLFDILRHIPCLGVFLYGNADM
jgi:hypothetical protein